MEKRRATGLLSALLSAATFFILSTGGPVRVAGEDFGQDLDGDAAGK
jgi:hypothetical protein